MNGTLEEWRHRAQVAEATAERYRAERDLADKAVLAAKREADELREQLRASTSTHTDWQRRCDDLSNEVARLREENERLREALRTIDLMCSCEYPERTYVGKGSTVADVRQVVQEALVDE